MVNGGSVTMKVSKPGTSAKCTFTATAGERVTEAVTSLVTSDGSDCGTLALLAPNKTTVVDSSGKECELVGVGPDALKVSGTYTVRLTLYSNTATGTATLTVST
jgi:hypothetical protein